MSVYRELHYGLCIGSAVVGLSRFWVLQVQSAVLNVKILCVSSHLLARVTRKQTTISSPSQVQGDQEPQGEVVHHEGVHQPRPLLRGRRVVFNITGFINNDEYGEPLGAGRVEGEHAETESITSSV